MQEVQPDATIRDWSELPLDALSSVFAKLGAVEVLMGAGLVSHSWLRAAKLPELWLSVHMARHEVVAEKDKDVLCAMAKVAVDRSDGRLEVFAGKRFVSDELLKYIGDRSPNSLKGLGLISCLDVSNEGFTELTTKSHLLQDLVLLDCPNVGGYAYGAAARACPQLERLALRKGWYDLRGGALGIAAMRELRDLGLVGSDLTTEELVAVVDACPRLERLCVRDCHNVVVDEDLRAKCARIKTLTLPYVQDRLARYYSEFWATNCDGDFDDWRSD